MGDHIKVKDMPSIQKKHVIIGAGPVGLCLALFLARRGVATTVLEKRKHFRAWSRAIGWMPSGLSVLKRENLHLPIDEGCFIPEAHVHCGDTYCGSLHLAFPEQDIAGILALGQSRSQSALLEQAQKEELIDLCLGESLLSLDLIPSGYKIKSSQRVLHCERLFACDGVHSSVGEALGLKKKIKNNGQRFIMADASHDRPYGREAHLFFNQDYSLESFPLEEGKRRWIRLLPANYPEEKARDHLINGVCKVSGLAFSENDFQDPFIFDIQWAILKQWQKGKICFLGDAAHAIPPIGGQGLNLGVLDAWSLADTLCRTASQSEVEQNRRLKKWEARRKKAALMANRRALRNTWIGTRQGRILFWLRKLAIQSLLKSPAAKAVARQFLMLDLPL